MAGARKAANSHSSLHCCGCSCSLSCHMIIWSRTDLQFPVCRTDNKGALLYTVRCSALRAELGSPRGRAKGTACNCAICHISLKKRSASAPIRSVNCLTNAPPKGKGFFLVLQRGFPLTGINFDSPGATEKRIPRQKARDSFWCSSGDSNPNRITRFQCLSLSDNTFDNFLLRFTYRLTLLCTCCLRLSSRSV